MRRSTRVASRLLKARLDGHVCQLLNWYRGKIDGYKTSCARRKYGVEVVEQMDQVSGDTCGRTQRKFGECRGPGVNKTKVSDEHLIVDTHEMHANRSIQYKLLQYRSHSQKIGTLIGNQWATIQKQGLGGKTFHASPDSGTARFERIWADDETIMADGERCDAVSVECSDNSERTSCIFRRWNIVKLEWNKITVKVIVDNQDSGGNGDQCWTRSCNSTSVYAVRAKQDHVVGCP